MVQSQLSLSIFQEKASGPCYCVHHVITCCLHHETTQVTIFSDPMVSALAALTDKDNIKYRGKGTFSKGQYIPIGGEECTYAHAGESLGS